MFEAYYDSVGFHGSKLISHHLGAAMIVQIKCNVRKDWHRLYESGSPESFVSLYIPVGG